MNIVQKVRSIIVGILMIIAAIVMIIFPDVGYIPAIIILGVSLLIAALRSLHFYFTMARHMVGGRTLLYLAIIMLDAGVFSLTLSNVPKIIIIIYLFITHAFSGAVDIMRALEAKRFKAPHWKFRLTYGIINIAVGVVCVIMVRHIEVSVIVYSLGLIFAAVSRIINAFRKTQVAYIG